MFQRTLFALAGLITGALLCSCSPSPTVKNPPTAEAKDTEGPGGDGIQIGSPDAGANNDAATAADATPTADPAPQPSGPCAILGNGAHCEKGVLILCEAGQAQSETTCPKGCIATPGDLPDVCAQDPGSGEFCQDKGDGVYCEFATLVTCAGGTTAEQAPCPLGCVATPSAHCLAEQGDDYCQDKVDGAWCALDALVNCQNGDVAQTYPCDHGCVPAPPGEPDSCAPGANVEAGFCGGQSDGAFCDGDTLIVCAAEKIAGQTDCLHGCLTLAGAQPDVCGPGGPETWCSGKADGLWCKGEGLLVMCDDGAVSSEQPCDFGCIANAVGKNDACAQGNGDFCTGKQNGAWCNGEGLAICNNDQITSQVACPWGCLSMAEGTDDACAQGQFCTPVPAKTSSSPPDGSCSYMDWDLSPDGFYLNSKFGTTNDPTTLGNSTTCGFLQGQYNAHGCVWDKGSGGCVDGNPDIPWVQGHVDYSFGQVISAVDANMNGDVPFPQYFYVAGAQRFGCGTTLRVTNPQNGRCVVVYTEDGGPGSKYESAPYGGRRILDSSPAVVQYLQLQQTGWKNSDLVYVEWGQAGDVPGAACTPCGSVAAKLGSEANKPVWDVLHMVPSCKPGTSGGTGNCPSGNGNYCGSAAGLDGDTLYLCQNGQWTPSEACQNGCQANPPGQDDSCKQGELGLDECPSGDGLYCGGTVGLDNGTLYFCSGGNFAAAEVCPDGCQTNPPGTPDGCAGGGGGSGALVMCNPFKPAQSVTCGYGCYSGHKGSDYAIGNGTPVYAPIAGIVSKVVDTVTGQTCAPNFGSYVKIQQGAYEVILAHMSPTIPVNKGDVVDSAKQVGTVSNTGYTLAYIGGAWVCQQGGGHHLHLEVRKNGVPFDPFASSDVVWSGSCTGGGGGDDFCFGKVNGLWCKGDTLVNCQGGQQVSAESCENGCVQMAEGTPDACAGGATGSCPSGNGLYCGSAANKDPDTLYNCANGAWSVAQVCGNGCVQMPAGQSDQCANEPQKQCPSGNGLYCGATLGLDAGKLYNCQNGNSTAVETCKNGCLVAPAGQSDQCKPDPQKQCPSGNGLYCGATLGLDSGKLYNCQNGNSNAVETCKNGCVVAPAGQDDTCKADPVTGCPSGNGLYCGGPVGKDSKTLYNCSNGSYSFNAFCGAGCNVAPAGQSDSCKSGACPSGNGAYCGQSVGLTSSKLYNCSNAKYTVKQSCSGTCVVAPPGQADYCP